MLALSNVGTANKQISDIVLAINNVSLAMVMVNLKELLIMGEDSFRALGVLSHLKELWNVES